MSACHYVVAERHFIVYDTDGVVGECMRRRYGAFAVPAGGAMCRSVLFDLTIVPPFASLSGTTEVARWSHNGLECLLEMTETEVSVSWLLPETGAAIARMQCSRDFRHAKAWLSGDEVARECCADRFLMLLFALTALPTQTLLFHASAVCCQGKAYLFLGKSGTGKSTHSRLWLEHIGGTELVNDDCPAVGIRDGQVIVYGTPWSGKTPCYRNVSFPVGAFVRLRQEERNRIVRENVVQAWVSLLAASSGVGWDLDFRKIRQDMIETVISAVPVYRLGCRPDAAAAKLCYETVTSQLLADEKN